VRARHAFDPRTRLVAMRDQDRSAAESGRRLVVVQRVTDQDHAFRRCIQLRKQRAAELELPAGA
jgi:hypothetical protein